MYKLNVLSCRYTLRIFTPNLIWYEDPISIAISIDTVTQIDPTWIDHTSSVTVALETHWQHPFYL